MTISLQAETTCPATFKDFNIKIELLRKLALYLISKKQAHRTLG